ncbi:hypothetical protein E0493_10180 [Roseomonas sp. M0104]|uniref:Uncharacterized protein n=1 Tax=Teichococcus coralli TaxID=2545983 RepID=A0A845BC97_9PROT|nr:hypothetical protein [Pseudoroseomonas coralli]MXP63714.1 hypothetical protein [Pseudoroseomonas coralli]
MSAPRRLQGAVPRIAPRHALAEGGQRVWIGFGGRADRLWLRLLRPGFRHCFAVLGDSGGWTVVEPLSGRLLVSRPELGPEFDLPGFYRRAGLTVLGPFAPGGAFCGVLPGVLPYSCVAVCRALLGEGAPRALTPRGLYRKLQKFTVVGKKSLTTPPSAGKKVLVNG